MPADGQLADLLLRWETLRRQGQSISASDLCRDCPELEPELRRRIAALESLEPVLGATLRSSDANTRPISPADAPAVFDALRPGASPVTGYELIERLGRGGFGEVWKASAPGGFLVALKFVFLDQPMGNVELRSLEIVKSLRHPNVLATFGAWQVMPYLIVAMELADQTLWDRCQQARREGHRGIPASELLGYMREVARGIDYLNSPRHALSGKSGVSIQHRDIKPQNILLVGGGVKVADFGLVRFLEHSVTGHTGSMTPAYAAPEFLRGQTSNSSDQYCLAVTYCELRGGRLPFAGAAAQIVAGHLFQPPDLTMLDERERPPISRALQKDPADRWPNCRDLVEALAEGLCDPIDQPCTPPLVEDSRLPKATRLKLWGLAGAAMLGLLAWTAWRYGAESGLLANKAPPGAPAAPSLAKSTPSPSGKPQEKKSPGNSTGNSTAPPGTGGQVGPNDQKRAGGASPAEKSVADADRIAPDDSFDAELPPDPDGPAPADPALAPSRLPAPKPAPAEIGRRVEQNRSTSPPRQTAEETATGAMPREIGQLVGHTAGVRCLVLGPQPGQLVTGGDDGTVRIWDLASERELSCPAKGSDGVTCLAATADGRFLAWGGKDHVLHVWDATLGAQAWQAEEHADWISGVAFSSDGGQLLSCSPDESVRLWDVGSGKQVLELDRVEEKVWCVAFSPRARRAVTGGRDQRVRLWELETGLCVDRLVEHGDPVWCVAWLPDGQRVISGGGSSRGASDFTMRLWDVPGKKEIFRLSGHDGNVGAVAVSRDGRRAVSGSIDQSVRVWDLESGLELYRLDGHSDIVYAVSFGADDHSVISAGRDRTVRLWRLPE